MTTTANSSELEVCELPPRHSSLCQQAFSPLEKCILRNLVLREWRPFLTPDERDLIMYVFDNSIEWGRLSLEAPFSHMTTGMRASGQWTLTQIMITRTTFYKLTAALKARGALLVESVLRRFTRLTLNPEWSPADGVPTMALALSKDRRAALGGTNVAGILEKETTQLSAARTSNIDRLSGGGTTESEFIAETPDRLSAMRTTVVRERDPLEHTYKHERKEKEESDLKSDQSQAASVDRFPFIRKRVRPTQTTTPSTSEARLQVECIAPRENPKPGLTARENLQRLQNQEAPRRAAFAEKAKLLDTLLAYQGTWAAAWTETYDVAVPAWSKTEGFMLRSVLKSRYPTNILARHDFIDFVTRNWRAILPAKFGWMNNSPPPTLPKLSFFLSPKIIPGFLDAYAERRQYEVAAMTTGDEGEVKRLMAQGLTRDAAMRKVGERDAVSQQMTKDRAIVERNSDMVARAEAARADVLEQRKQLLRDRAMHAFEQRQQLQPVATGASTFEPFDELPPFAPMAPLPPFDPSHWN